MNELVIKEWFHDGTSDYHIYDPTRGHMDYRLACGLQPKLGHGAWANVAVINRCTDVGKVQRDVCPGCVAALILNRLGE
jgi:hypothetical protein